MATIDIGKLAIGPHKGDYNNSTSYVANEIVYYNGSAYIAKQSTTGNLPTDTNNWNVYSAGSGGIWNSSLSLGSAGQSVIVNAAGNALEFGTISTGWIKHTYYESNTRVQHGDSAHRVMFSFAFTKSESSSILILQGIIPVQGENSDHVGPYGIIDGGGAEPANDGDHHKGILYIPTNTGAHPGGFIYNQRFTGVSAGSHTFYAGYNPRDNGSNQPGYLNYNHNDQSRNQQTATTFIMQEVSA